MKAAAVASPSVGSLLVMGSTEGIIIVSTGSTGTRSCPGFWLVSAGSRGAACKVWAKAAIGAKGPDTNRAATRAAEIQAEIFIVYLHVAGSLPRESRGLLPQPLRCPYGNS